MKYRVAASFAVLGGVFLAASGFSVIGAFITSSLLGGLGLGLFETFKEGDNVPNSRNTSNYQNQQSTFNTTSYVHRQQPTHTVIIDSTPTPTYVHRTQRQKPAIPVKSSFTPAGPQNHSSTLYSGRPSAPPGNAALKNSTFTPAPSAGQQPGATLTKTSFTPAPTSRQSTLYPRQSNQKSYTPGYAATQAGPAALKNSTFTPAPSAGQQPGATLTKTSFTPAPTPNNNLPANAKLIGSTFTPKNRM